MSDQFSNKIHDSCLINSKIQNSLLSKKQKTKIEEAIELFNKKPDIGFRALVSLSMVDPLDSQKTAKFFFDNLNIISQEKLGDFFGEPDD